MIHGFKLLKKKGKMREKAFPAVILIAFLVYVTLTNKDKAAFFGADWQRTGVFDSNIRAQKREVEWWKFKTDGEVTSSPVIHRGVVYFGSWDRHLYAVDIKTGNTVWEFKAEAEVPFSPAISGDKIYFTSVDGNLYALNLDTGERIWKYTLENSTKISTSPAIVNGKIYFGSRDGNLYSVELSTGKQNWRFETGDFIDSSPAIVNGAVYFGSFDGNFYAIDAKTGKQNWRFKTGGEVISSPAVSDNVVFFGSRDSYLYALDANTGEEKWKFTTDAFVDSTPAVFQNRVYFGSRDGNLYSLDENTGEEIWRFETGSPIDSSPAVFSGKVFFGDFEGSIYALGTNNGKELWKFETKGVILSSPSIAGGLVYTGSNDGNMYVLDVNSGKVSAKMEIQVSENAQSVDRFGVYELTINHTDIFYKNPWEDLEIRAVFTNEDGDNIKIKGFYYDTDKWKVRFSPNKTGKWSWLIKFITPFENLEESGAFTVKESDHPGFIRIHSDNPFRLVFEDGTLFNAIGIGGTVRDSNDNGHPFDDWGMDGGFVDIPERPEWGKYYGNIVEMDTYLKAYGDSGAGFNLFRWSVDNFSFKLWEDISENGNRYLVREGIWGDRLVQALGENGLRIWMTVFGFDHPFDYVNGTEEKGEALKRYLNYIVARYGAYVDIWELANEAEVSNAWAIFLADYLRSIDPYKRLISVSWEKPQLEEIDINAPHWYEKESEFSSDLRTSQKIDEAKRWGKPVVFAEQGNSGANWDETSALRMRLRAWTAFFEEGILIFWNTSQIKNFRHPESANLYIGPEERKFIKILQDFTKKTDPDIKKTGISVLSSGVRAYGLESSDEILGYLHHFNDHESSINAEIRLNIPKDGNLEWLNPETGKIVKSEKVVQGTKVVQSQEFSVDLAFKLKPEE